MQTTPLAETHTRLGARMVEFGGWLMPIQYPAGILAEHRHTREQASLFDTCHMGEFRVTGTGAADALDALLPRRASDQPVGACRYNFLLTDAGGVVDDLLVYRLAAEEFLLVVNAGTCADDAAWLRERLPAGVAFTDESASWGKLDLQGPASFQVLARLGVATSALPPYYHWTRLRLCGLDLLLSRTGYTGERGVELYVAREAVTRLWDAISADPAVKPAGLGARDTLRLEMGYPLYGHELNRETTPVEAGFGGLLDLQGQGHDFVGRAALLRTPQRRLVGLQLDGRRAARAGMNILDAAGQHTVGRITSGAFAPSLGVAVALGYVDGSEGLPMGSRLRIGEAGGEAMLTASVTKLPFYRGGTARAVAIY